ncbi:hypothetical protein GW17_00009139 [Ensete ventricosum]|nr:hypothetical protein GW17_00009139 [Ensete ventricosum]
MAVVPVLFRNSLQQSKDNPVVSLSHIFGVEPVKIISPATDSEVAIALRVLEGCCLLHSGSAALAHKHKAIEVHRDFRECHAIEKVTDLIKDEQADENIRLVCFRLSLWFIVVFSLNSHLLHFVFTFSNFISKVRIPVVLGKVCKHLKSGFYVHHS